MSEMIRNMALLVLVACSISSPKTAAAQGVQEEGAPTLVYGKSETAPGVSEEVLLEQPDNNENPLGNPIVGIAAPTAQPQQAEPAMQPNQENVHSQEPQDNQALGKQFQNTLMEANGEVYDVQAYPEADLKAIGNSSDPQTIYSPNVNP